MKRYHAFWMNPYGHQRLYKVFDDPAEVCELARLAAGGERGNVFDLHVVYGELVEFEPIEVVKAFRIKES